MRPIRIRTIHKWLSLTVAGLWLLQAATGLMISFRADIDDFFIGNKATKTDVQAFASAIEDMQENGDAISSIWISGGREGQYDAYLTRDGESYTVRFDGLGNRVRDRADTVKFSDGAVFETLTQFHKSLMLGSTGYIFLFVSGVLLITNIVLGLVMGWPKRRRLTAFAKASSGTAATALSGWHWRFGLWGALPAFIVVLAGTALTQADVLENALGVEESTPASQAAPTGPTISHAEAIETAFSTFPGSTLVSMSLPSEVRQWYKFRLNAPGEMPRLYGATRVYVGLDGEVLETHAAANSAANERIAEALYPLHTGQIGGVAGRLINVAVGLWLFLMAYVGIKLWLSRRRTAQT